MSCRDGESRHVRLFLSPGERNRAVYAWEKLGHCGLGDKCRFAHVMLKIEDETENAIPNNQTTEEVPATLRPLAT